MVVGERKKAEAAYRQAQEQARAEDESIQAQKKINRTGANLISTNVQQPNSNVSPVSSIPVAVPSGQLSNTSLAISQISTRTSNVQNIASSSAAVSTPASLPQTTSSTNPQSSP
jgi:hypothetical protein